MNTSIHASVNPTTGQAEASAWAGFAAPRDDAEFCRNWLAILCLQIEKVDGALLVLGPEADGGYGAAAVWPDRSRNMQYLATIAEKTLQARRGIVERVVKERRQLVLHVKQERRAIATGKGVAVAHVGYPIEVNGELRGAVVLELHQSQELLLQRALRLLHWGSAWLQDHFRQQAVQQLDAKLGQLSLASDMLATTVQFAELQASALALVNELASRLQCSRVALGFEHKGNIEIFAISNTAKFDRKTNLMRALSDAMDEVLDLGSALVYPAQETGLDVIAHRQLAELAANVAICSVPLLHNGQTVGVLTFERTAQPYFSLSEQQLCKTIAMLLGPVLWLKKQQELRWWQRLYLAQHELASRLFGPAYPGTKMLALLSLATVVLFSVVDANYRVASKTVIEGAVQRAVVAPYQGFVQESQLRAGDQVKKGQVLARLDDRDLQLERQRLSAEHAKLDRQYRQMLAEQDRASMMILQAQLTQLASQLGLVEEKIQRAVLRAPFDGLVVSGDLSQLLGAPVEQGKVLFEVAPLDQYRVVMQVDERDIAQLQQGQRGELSLAGMPYQVMPFEVKQITPVSVAEDGVNYFQVEAKLDTAPERLRPGMEGVAKVSVGERKLIWIWTHGLMDWARLWLWKWML